MRRVQLRMIDQVVVSRAEGDPCSMSSKELYAHLALPPGHIRLLDLDAAPNSHYDAPLTGALRIERLNDLSKFNSLSYLWDSETSQGATIRCFPSGSELSITTNCAQALQFIRRNFGSVTIWVDAICIDQDNEKEKEGQIPLMGEIYSRAETGYIWLDGEGDEFRQAAHELHVRAIALKRLPLAYAAARSKAQKHLELAQLKQRRLNDVFARRGRGTYDPTVNNYSCHARLRVLFEHAWLGRIWTFQELILSRNPLVLFGDSVILWEDLVNGVLITPQSIKGQKRWETAIQLWLDFPRQQYLNEVQTADWTLAIHGDHSAAPEILTFRKLISSSSLDGIDAPWYYILFRYGMEGVRLWLWALSFWFTELIATLFMIALLAFIVVYFLIEPLRAVFSSNPNQFVMLIVAVVIVPGVFIVIMQYLLWGNSKTLPVERIIYGTGGQERYQWSSSCDTSKTGMLDAIWTTLQARKSSNDHDMAYGLNAILKACGIMTSTPDYSQSIQMTYQTLFQGILDWDARAIQMIVDARVESPSAAAWPSWLPDWRIPETNSWLFGNSNLKHTWLRQFPKPSRPPAISGERLSVSGRHFDKIEKCFRFVSVNLQDRHRLLDSLGSLINFMEIVYDLKALEKDLCRSGIIFAVLKGLSVRPKIRPKRYELTYYDPTDDSTGFAGWKDYALDFSSFPTEFDSFCRLNRIAFELCKARAAQRDTNQVAEELLNRVREDKDALSFLIESLNTLADKKRCIFVLSSGKVGTGSHLAADGDEVLIIQGVSTPLAARKKVGQDSYRLLGPVLVHALFEEEMWHKGLFDDIVLE